jgi:peptidoglycan/xylan/chitin deacetylase (PgdA/CDA1 family)
MPLAPRSRSRRDAVAAALQRSGLGALLRIAPAWRGLVVLNYHRIGTPGDGPFDPALWTATAEDFDAQVAFLAREFDVIGPDDAASAARRRDGRRVLVTFDDGYRDNVTTALPILRRHGATATFFLTTGFLDAARLAWWDEIAWMTGGRDTAGLVDRAKQLPGGTVERFLDDLGARTGTGRAPASAAAGTWMTWDEARTMAAAGMHVGGHTVNHPILARLDPAAQRAEILGCKARLEAELGGPMRWFSYPNGDPGSYDAHTRAALAEAGVELAFAFDGGFHGRGRFDPYAVPRIAAGPSTGHDRFAATVTLPQLFCAPRPARRRARPHTRSAT